MADALLEVTNLSSGYGDSIVLDDLSFSMAENTSLALLGRNGVGKSTLMLTIMGHLRVRTGKILFRGKDISRLLPHQRVLAGLAWVPQGRDVFPSLSVVEHLEIAIRPGPWTVARVMELFPNLQRRRRNLGSQLSGGEQQMLAIGRALVTNPALLLLDEPLEGLAPVVVSDLAKRIEELTTGEGLSILIAEQQAPLALKLAQSAIVLERGRLSYAGPASTLLEDRDALNQLVGVRRVR